MAVQFQHLMERVDPVQPTIRFAAVLARFKADPALDLLPVVFERTVIGCLDRQTVFELAGSDMTGETLQNAAITPLLDEAPATVSGETRIGGYAARSAAGDGKALHQGVIVLDSGAYAGVVRPRVLASALAMENARRARAYRGLAERAKAVEARTKANEQEQARLQAVMAHELRTPLNAAFASADLLIQHTNSSEGRGLAKTVSEACEALDRLLDDLMVVSRADLGNLPVRPEPLSLKRFLAEVDGLWRPRCEAKGLTFSAVFRKSAAERVELDPSRLKQLSDNLLSNAVKFTETGSVDVFLSVEERGDGLVLVLGVADTGPGLQEETLQDLFKPFVRDPSAQAVDGAGLGLTVLKSVTNSLGGTLSHEPGAQRGSVFTVELPVERAGPRVVAGGKRVAAVRRFEMGDLLLIDDHEPSRVVLAQALSAAGYRVDGVHTLAQALRRIEHKPYQAVLCDLHLPDGDGEDIVRRIRSGIGTDPAMTVVAVTADRSETRMAACRAAGFDAIWTKPIRPNEAVLSLADLIIEHQSRAEIEAPRSAIA